MDKYIAALDMGSKYLKLAVARIEDGGPKVVYLNQISSQGIRYSRITKQTVKTDIKTLLDDVTNKTGIKIHALNISCQRWPVYDYTCSGATQRIDRKIGITVDEINSLKEAANNLNDDERIKNSDYSIIGFAAQEFCVDDEWGISEEEIIDTMGSEISGEFKFFFGKAADANNLETNFDGLDIWDKEYTFTPTCYIGNIITPAEANNGIAVIDIGSSVSSISVFYDGALRSYHSIPFGGDVISHDISKIANLSLPLSEEIKKGFGGCDAGYMGELAQKKLRIHLDGERKQLTIEELKTYIEARVTEIVDALLYMLEKDGDQEKLDCGIVLTGGSANLRGLYVWLKKYTGYQVRNAAILNKSFVFENEDTDNTVDYCNLWCLLDDAYKKSMFTTVNDVQEDVELVDGKLFGEDETDVKIKNTKKPEKEHGPRVPRTKKTPMTTINVLFDKIGDFVTKFGMSSTEREEAQKTNNENEEE